MKLRNKKTGMIGEVGYISSSDGRIIVNNIDDQDEWYSYNSLTELNEEWEDYKEPSKTIWQIKDSGELQDFAEDDFSDGYMESSKQIGNYFSSREEAEKAVEKLKAWKRLKDKGFRFERWGMGGEYGNTITFSDYIEYNDKTRADLDLLFRGEE